MPPGHKMAKSKCLRKKCNSIEASYYSIAALDGNPSHLFKFTIDIQFFRIST